MPDSLNYSAVAGAMRLTAPVTASATLIVVDTIAGLPAVPFKLLLDAGLITEEVVKVTSLSGLNLTVVRAWDGTAGVAHANQASVRHAATAEDFQLSRHHEGLTAGVHGTTGTVVGTTDVQGLSNKSIDLGLNTVTMTKAQLNTAVTDDDVVSLTGAETLTNKTLNSPTIATPTITGLPTASAFRVAIICTSSTRPASPQDGQHIYETDTKRLRVWDTTAWRLVSAKGLPYLQGLRTAALSVPNGTVTAVYLDSAVYSGMAWSGAANQDRVVVQEDGIYLVSYTVNYASAGGSIRLAGLFKNGAAVGMDSRVPPCPGGWDTNVIAMATVSAVAGDYFAFSAYQDSGGAVNIKASVSVSMLSER